MATKLSRLVDNKVRTAWVKVWAEEFLKGLQKLTTKDEIEPYCLQQMTSLEEEVRNRSKDGKEVKEESVLNSIATHLSQIRNAIKEWQKTTDINDANSYPHAAKEGNVQQHYALLYMNLPRDKHIERMAPTEQRKNEQRRNLTPIKHLDKYIDITEKLLESPYYAELSAGLIAATGRRMDEILSTAKFKQIGQFEADFEGQLKTKGEEKNYSAYTLVESSKVVDGILRLRRMVEIKDMKGWNFAKIDSGKNSHVNSIIREFFEELIDPPHGEKQLSSKNLRAAYAAIAIYFFCPTNHSESLFIKDRLGHTSDATASNYEDYQVVDINNKPLPRGAWVERIGEKFSEPKQRMISTRLRITVAAKEVINDQEFLLYPEQLSRVEELVRLAKIGKQFEEGKLVKEVVRIVEKPVEIIKEVEKIVEKPVNEVMESQPPVEDTNPVEETKTVEEVKSVDRFEAMSNEELRGCQAPGSALEKIRRSVRAIKVYNEQQAEKKNQWAINVSTLEDLSRCHSKAVKEYLESDEGRLQVIDYNLEKGFGFQQNRGKGSIKKYLDW